MFSHIFNKKEFISLYDLQILTGISKIKNNNVISDKNYFFCAKRINC